MTLTVSEEQNLIGRLGEGYLHNSSELYKSHENTLALEALYITMNRTMDYLIIHEVLTLENVQNKNDNEIIRAGNIWLARY